jgi:hypothetical protein
MPESRRYIPHSGTINLATALIESECNPGPGREKCPVKTENTEGKYSLFVKKVCVCVLTPNFYKVLIVKHLLDQNLPISLVPDPHPVNLDPQHLQIN